MYIWLLSYVLDLDLMTLILDLKLNFLSLVFCYAAGFYVTFFDSILGLHRISYPAPAPAEIRPNFHIRPYPAPAGYGRRI